MLRGLYTSASAMLGETVRLDVTANNLANAATPGYKRDVAVFESFNRMLVARMGDAEGGPGAVAPDYVRAVASAAPFGAPPPFGPARLGTLGTGSFLDHVFPRLQVGNAVRTDNPRDLSLDGPGFFVVQTPAGVRYVRTLSLTGPGMRLPDGARPLGVDGEFPDDLDGFVVNPDGEVRVGDRVVGRLRVVNFPNPEWLLKEGATVFSATPAAGAPFDVSTPVRSGALEASNAEPVREMVEMIAVMRAYEANQKAFQLQDGALDKAVNEVGRA